jgi:hypothetical protein
VPRTLRPLWTCPRCAAKFVVANSWHSCGRYRLEDLFARSEPYVLELFRRLQRMVHAAGPVTTVPQKTRLVFMVRVRFISVQVRKSYLLVGFLLARRVDDPRFAEITTYCRGTMCTSCACQRRRTSTRRSRDGSGKREKSGCSDT